MSKPPGKKFPFVEILTAGRETVILDRPEPFHEDSAVYLWTGHYGAILSRDQAEFLVSSLQRILAEKIPAAPKSRPRRRLPKRPKRPATKAEALRDVICDLSYPEREKEKTENKLTPCSRRANLVLVRGGKGLPRETKERADDERGTDDEDG